MEPSSLAAWGLDAPAAAAWLDAQARPGRGGAPDLVIVLGRVIEEHLGGLWVQTETGPVLCRSAGRLRRAHAIDPSLRPAVGDWVAVEVRGGSGGSAARGAEGPLPDEQRGTLHAVWPRRTALVRRAAGVRAVAQVVAANVDHVWILCPIETPSPKRLERWLALARAGGSAPAVILTKVDLGDPGPAVEALGAVAAGAPLHLVSARSGIGIEALRAAAGLGETVVLVGSSGVGKSTLVNALAGSEVRATSDVRSDGKGRHTTTTRALVKLAGDLLLLDTPGIRELGIALADESLDDAFVEIAALASGCKFRDCHHNTEPGCAVTAAVARGELDPARLKRFLGLGVEGSAGVAQLDEGAERRAKQLERVVTRAFKSRLKTKIDT